MSQQPPLDGREIVPGPASSRRRLAIAALALVVVALGATFAVIVGNSAGRRSDCEIGVGPCISEFRLSRPDGKLPTEEQFRDELPGNARLLMVWQLSEAQSFQPVTLRVTSQYSLLMVFVGCTGGGQLTVNVTDESTTWRTGIRVPCNGVIPTGLSFIVGDNTSAGPFTFEMDPQGNVADAEFFVRD